MRDAAVLVVLQCDVCTQQEANPNPERQYCFYELVACKGQSEQCSKWRDHVASSSQIYQNKVPTSTIESSPMVLMNSPNAQAPYSFTGLTIAVKRGEWRIWEAPCTSVFHVQQILDLLTVPERRNIYILFLMDEPGHVFSRSRSGLI